MQHNNYLLRLTFLALWLTATLVIRAQTTTSPNRLSTPPNDPQQTNDLPDSLKYATRPTKKDPFIGLTITTTHPYKATNAPPGYNQINILQVWSTNIIVQITRLENPTIGDAGCTAMNICKDLKPDLWTAALQLLLVKDTPTQTSREEIWGKKETWETTYEWWTPTQTFLRRCTSVGEIPIPYSLYEQRLKDIVLNYSEQASVTYPRVSFVGFRWLKSNGNFEPGQLYNPDPKFREWLRHKVDVSPPNLFQIVKRNDMPNTLYRTRWNRFPIEITKGETVVIDIFELPAATRHIQ